MFNACADDISVTLASCCRKSYCICAFVYVQAVVFASCRSDPAPRSSSEGMRWPVSCVCVCRWGDTRTAVSRVGGLGGCDSSIHISDLSNVIPVSDGERSINLML